MNVITMINEKGGVGKTTSAIHIASGLAIRGQRVLLIDTDAQAHSTYSLGQPDFGGLYRLLVQDAEWKEVLRAPDPTIWAGDNPAGSLYLLPSNIETRGIPQMIQDVDALYERLQELSDHIDTVVIDTSPTPSLLHAVIYYASDGVVFPAECEALSLDGLAKSAVRMRKESEKREYNGRPPLRLLGVQPTMYDGRTNAHEFGLSQIKTHFGEERTWNPISNRTIWRDAAYQRQTVFAYAPNSAGTNEAWEMIDQLENSLARINA
jgi:chromosome partitioning protein